jgi:hypothetical protein
MPANKLQILERKLMGIGLALFLWAYYMGNQLYHQPLTSLVVRDLCTMLAIAFVQWLVVRRIMVLLRKKYPHYRHTLLRVVLSVFIGGSIGMFVATLGFDLPQLITSATGYHWSKVLANFGPMFFFSALIVGAHEVLHNFYELRRIDKEREELKKANLQSQLNSLKTQVNPHFLFNSLNTLMSLISTSPPRAEQFVLELSSVYRYLLQASERELTTLHQELEFTHSYFHLLKTRFGSAIRLDLDTDPSFQEYLLPSLTLQLLLENAVKHNVVSASKPLTIHIETKHMVYEGKEQVYLVVQNNLQRKTQAVASDRMGLSNILTKFRLLDRQDVSITDDNGCFTVTLPLIKKHMS